MQTLNFTDKKTISELTAKMLFEIDAVILEVISHLYLLQVPPVPSISTVER